MGNKRYPKSCRVQFNKRCKLPSTEYDIIRIFHSVFFRISSGSLSLSLFLPEMMAMIDHVRGCQCTPEQSDGDCQMCWMSNVPDVLVMSTSDVDFMMIRGISSSSISTSILRRSILSSNAISLFLAPSEFREEMDEDLIMHNNSVSNIETSKEPVD
ncbi:hypothetical protein CEXT_93111 [Caerostris extrusa]|uniref:Uncharacterized protein n=1 Tax=Caerostris extrusa TaxID=172846 RepID=A0AAV4N5C2_CAEEX|nr:hypothetical protein CEXT_93111 [Caerostris extrusa]